MKKLSLIVTFLAICSVVIGQDMRTFAGVITSSEKEMARGDDKRVIQAKTKFTFGPGSIEIGPEMFAIVSKEFDGEGTTSFKCTKGRSTFVVTWHAGVSIKVEEERENTIVTTYRELESS